MYFGICCTGSQDVGHGETDSLKHTKLENFIYNNIAWIWLKYKF